MFFHNALEHILKRLLRLYNPAALEQDGSVNLQGYYKNVGEVRLPPGDGSVNQDMLGGMVCKTMTNITLSEEEIQALLSRDKWKNGSQGRMTLQISKYDPLVNNLNDYVLATYGYISYL